MATSVVVAARCQAALVCVLVPLFFSILCTALKATASAKQSPSKEPRHDLAQDVAEEVPAIEAAYVAPAGATTNEIEAHNDGGAVALPEEGGPDAVGDAKGADAAEVLDLAELHHMQEQQMQMQEQQMPEQQMQEQQMQEQQKQISGMQKQIDELLKQIDELLQDKDDARKDKSDLREIKARLQKECEEKQARIEELQAICASKTPSKTPKRKAATPLGRTAASGDEKTEHSSEALQHVSAVRDIVLLAGNIEATVVHTVPGYPRALCVHIYDADPHACKVIVVDDTAVTPTRQTDAKIVIEITTNVNRDEPIHIAFTSEYHKDVMDTGKTGSGPEPKVAQFAYPMSSITVNGQRFVLCQLATTAKRPLATTKAERLHNRLSKTRIAATTRPAVNEGNGIGVFRPSELRAVRLMADIDGAQHGTNVLVFVPDPLVDGLWSGVFNRIDDRTVVVAFDSAPCNVVDHYAKFERDRIYLFLPPRADQ